MNRRGWIRTCLGLCAFLLAGFVPAQQPPDPVGWFDFRTVEDGGGDSVTIELRLRLFNRNAAALEIAGVAIADSIHSSLDLATIPGFALEPRTPLDRIERVTIPRGEYDLWRRGATPKLRILSTDGRRTGGRIELTRGRLGEGQ